MSRAVEIVLEVKDKATPALEKSNKAVDSWAKKASGSFKDFKQSVIALNQGFQLFERIAGSAVRGLSSLVSSALEYRSKNDEAKRSIEAFGEKLQLVSARIGDVFIPLIHGISTAVGPMLTKLMDWLKVNEKLIAGKIVEWAVSLGRTLSTVVFAAIRMTAQAWHGWKLAIGVAQSSVQGFVASVLEGSSKVAGAVGAKGLSQDLQLMGFEWREAANESEAASIQMMTGLESTLAGIDSAAAVVAESLASIETASTKAIGTTASKLTTLKEAYKNQLAIQMELDREEEYAREQQQEIIEERKREEARRDEADKARVVQLDIEFAERERAQELTKQMIDLDKQHEENAVRAAAVIGGGFAHAFAGAIVGARNLGEAFRAVLVNMAQQLIATGILKLLGKLFSFIGGGPLGVIGEIFGFANGGPVRGYATGGGISGGTPGVDSVPILAQQGEHILSVPQVQSIKSGRPTDVPGLGTLGGTLGGSVGAPVTNLIVNAFSNSRAMIQKIERDVWGPERARMKRNRLIRE